MDQQTKQCAVHGLVVAPRGRMPGAMCGYVITGGKLCGFSGQCEHQREPKTEAQRTQAQESKQL